MSELIGVVGASGTGKSTSIHANEELGIKGLDPKETVIINIAGKGLPFKGWKNFYIPFEGKTGNFLTEGDSVKIIQTLKYINENRPDIHNIILDDVSYIMTFEFMEKALRKDWEKFNEIGKHAFDVFNIARKLRTNLKVFILTHSEEIQKDFETIRKIKTIGKMIDSMVTLEGLFLIVLYTGMDWDSKTEKGSYYFVTNRTNEYPAKSPFGMFNSIKIPNDLGLVAEFIDKYNEDE